MTKHPAVELSVAHDMGLLPATDADWEHQQKVADGLIRVKPARGFRRLLDQQQVT